MEGNRCAGKYEIIPLERTQLTCFLEHAEKGRPSRHHTQPNHNLTHNLTTNKTTHTTWTHATALARFSICFHRLRLNLYLPHVRHTHATRPHTTTAVVNVPTTKEINTSTQAPRPSRLFPLPLLHLALLTSRSSSPCLRTASGGVSSPWWFPLWITFA